MNAQTNSKDFGGVEITVRDGALNITEQVRITAKGLSKLAKLIHPTARLIA